MECRSCGYSLWNIRGRSCPECGAPFRPSEFEFLPNQVEYCCPHCSQAYYGTSTKGHLEPSAFECVKCGGYITMDDDMLLRPVGSAAAASRSGMPIPWLRRDQIGFLAGWWQTVVMGFNQPREIMRGVGTHDPQGFGFYATLMAVLTVIGWAVGLSFNAALGLPAPGFAAMPSGTAGVGMLFALVFGLTIGILFALLIIWIWSALIHLLLVISGGAEQPMSRTTQALLYTAGPTCLQVIPWIGGIIGTIWWIVSASRAVSEAQRTSIVRSAICVALPPVTIFVSCFGLMFVALGAGLAAGGFAGMGPGGFNAGRPVITHDRLAADAVMARNALRDYAREYDDYGPRHGVVLLLETETVEPAVFDRDNKHTVGGRSTSAAASSLAGWKQGTMQQLLDTRALSTDPVHRVGQIVFAHAEIDLINPDTPQDLWVVINVPPFLSDLTGMSLQSAPAMLLSGESFAVIGPSGTTRLIPAPRFLEALEEQNELRRSLGLPVIGDPLLISGDS